MSEFVKHLPCPSCGSRDNLGLWDDGHKYCFGCGYGIPGYKSVNLADLRELANKNKVKTKGTNYGNLCLPSDCTSTLPKEPKKWLDNYGITEREILVNHIVWSESYGRLYFPIFDLYGNLVLYQGRYFGSNPVAPRYSTRGQVDNCLHFIGNLGDSIIVVEDVVSAIKVGRQFCAMPLFGSTLSVERIIALSNRFSSLGIWLDRDKAKYALKAHLRASSYFNRVFTIITDKDPKCYSDVLVKEKMNGCP
jgi:hypothetical protein